MFYYVYGDACFIHTRCFVEHIVLFAHVVHLFPYSVCARCDNCEIDLAGQVPEIEVTVVTVTTPVESESWRIQNASMVAFVAKW